MSGFDLSGKEAGALLEAAETLNRLHDQALRRIATLEARLARVLGHGREWRNSAWELAGAKHGHRGRVWSGSRKRTGGRTP